MSLNASTLFPFELDIIEQVRIAAAAGYEGIEIWVRDIEKYIAQGGNLAALRQVIDETGITVVNAIAFFKWADSDDAVRVQGLHQAAQEMHMLAELGCRSAAAPPFGNVENVSLDLMARYFTELAKIGRSLGVEPYLEFWGRAKRLSRLSDAVTVAIQSGLPDVKILLDPYHMYTGGSDVNGLSYLKGEHIGIVHVNDYPAVPGRDTITDADRVFPGDGIAPTAQIAELLYAAGYTGFLSLELFMQSYGDLTALDVARLGRQKSISAFSVQQ